MHRARARGWSRSFVHVVRPTAFRHNDGQSGNAVEDIRQCRGVIIETIDADIEAAAAGELPKTGKPTMAVAIQMMGTLPAPGPHPHSVMTKTESDAVDGDLKQVVH